MNTAATKTINCIEKDEEIDDKENDSFEYYDDDYEV